MEPKVEYEPTPAEKSWLEYVGNTHDESEILRFPALLWKRAFYLGQQLGREEGLKGIPPIYPKPLKSFEEYMKSNRPGRKTERQVKKDPPIQAS